MNKIILALGFVVAACNSTPTAKIEKTEPTSEIPAKREFPLNTSIDPCNNFYEYACSKVNASFKLREDRTTHTFAFSDSAERILEAKKKFLKDLVENKNLSARGKVLQTVYVACMNEEAQKKEERSIVEKTLKEVADLKSNKEFQNFLSDKILSKDFSFLGIDDITNLDDPTWNDVYILSELQSLPERSYYEKPELMKDFEQLVTEFFKTVDPINAGERAKKVIEFEKQFAQTYPLPAEFRDIIAKKTDVSREFILKNYPNFQLSGILKYIPPRTKIRNLAPANFEFLNKALDQSSIQTLKDIYAFHSLGDLLDDAYPEYFKLRFEFSRKHLGGPNVRPDRQERCTKLVMSRFGRELDSELLPTLFPDFSQSKVVHLAEQIRASIVKGIEKNTWLTPQAKAKALAKIKTAKLQLVKPSREEDWNFNPPGQYSKTTPIENSRTLSLNLTKKMLRELGQTRNRNRWNMGPLTVNAYYTASDNTFVLPIGILQYPFYDANLPEKVNFAAVGTVVGHELGHAIDDKGSRYDEMGRLKSWMTDEDLKNFRERGSRLSSQFQKVGFNGELTLGENTADLVGLTFSYDTAFPDGKGDQKSKQEFFAQYARLWCSVARPKYLELLFKVDPHAQGFARVNEQVKHQPGFKEAYNCPMGSPMTLSSADLVRIW